jgi:hypothetical protein
MFTEDPEKKQFWYWPALVGVLLILVAIIQIARVNRERPREAPIVDAYTASGPLVSDVIKVPAGDFFTKRINLNRRGKISGTFRTENLKAPVSVIVMDEKNFDNWKLGLEHSAVVQTGYVPGGKISPVLEPGVYFVVIDNRSETPRSVNVDFTLE